MRDSLARAVGSKAVGLASYGQNGLPGVARNVTAIATGDESVGVQGGTTILAGAQSHKVELQNTIASGEGADLTAFANAVYQVATTISVSTSNYDDVETDPGASIVDGGGNQTAAPLFLNAAAGDFREAAGSPTIDAGSAGDSARSTPTGSLESSARRRTSAPSSSSRRLPRPARHAAVALRSSRSTFRAVNVGEAIFSAGKQGKRAGEGDGGLRASRGRQGRPSRSSGWSRGAGSARDASSRPRPTREEAVPLFQAGQRRLHPHGRRRLERFMFSGRISGRALKPGPYRLLGSAGGGPRRRPALGSSDETAPQRCGGGPADAGPSHPAASAAQRYAAPGASGTACTQAAPCSIHEAVEKAKADDEVIVGSGNYSILSAVEVPFKAERLNIHGDLAGPAPRVSATFGGPALGLFALGVRLSHLEVVNSAPGAVGVSCINTGLVDRVRASVTGDGSAAITAFGTCKVLDSVARADGKDSLALGATGGTKGEVALAENVTAIATGAKSVGIRSAFVEVIIQGSSTLEVRNTIARGAGVDLLAEDGIFGPGDIFATHSNFVTSEATFDAEITDGGGNQDAAPLFVDAAGGDYREAPGSPTIDAGTTELIGPLDLAGNPRALGAAPDIGAFEFVPPTPPPPPVARLQLLTITKEFRAVNFGGAIASKRRKSTKPIAGTVGYAISAPGQVSFSVERVLRGRRVGKSCVKQTKANKSKKKCTLSKPVKGGFTHTGVAGANAFKFSGRINDKALQPGGYSLLGSAGGVSASANFKIAK